MPRVSGKKTDGPSQIELPLFGARGNGGDKRAAAEESPRTAAPSPSPSRAASSPSRAASLPSPAEVTPRAGLRVIQGGGQRTHEALQSRDAVVRVLVEAGADLLLRRISVERADEIERKVDRILRLFDQVDHTPLLMPVLQRQLDDLEALMRETRSIRQARR